MAIVSRLYVHRLPVGPNLALFVDPINTPTINAQYERAVVRIDYEDSVPGLVDDLDSYLAQFDLVHSTTASPRQMFEYVATGAEGDAIAIGAGQGFLIRATANYIVQLTVCKPNANAFKIYSIRDGSLTVNGFTVDASVALEAGDTLCFTVEDKL